MLVAVAYPAAGGRLRFGVRLGEESVAMIVHDVQARATEQDLVTVAPDQP